MKNLSLLIITAIFLASGCTSQKKLAYLNLLFTTVKEYLTVQAEIEYI